jgi:endonuclease/exonuclease/phosphatase family metal-dependent hydrolase
VSQCPGIAIASLNLHGGRGGDGAPFDTAAACRALAADIVLLQEAWHADGQDDPAAVAAADLGGQLIRADLRTGTTLHRLGIAADDTPGQWGLAMLTALPVTGYRVVDLGQFPGDRGIRAAQVVTLSTPVGGALRVVNTHLNHRFASPLQLVWLTRVLAATAVPTVIAGDLNMPWPVTGLAVGHRPAVRGRTYPAHRPFVQLDHVLVSNGIRAAAGQVLPHAGSDHLPIRACLQVG